MATQQKQPPPQINKSPPQINKSAMIKYDDKRMAALMNELSVFRERERKGVYVPRDLYALLKERQMKQDIELAQCHSLIARLRLELSGGEQEAQKLVANLDTTKKPITPHQPSASSVLPTASAPPSRVAETTTITNLSLGDFELGALLSHTPKYGAVYVAQEIKSNRVVALKVTLKERLYTRALAERLTHVVNVRSKLRHPSVQRLYDHFVDEKSVFTVLEYAPRGTLNKELKLAGIFDERRAAILASALSYCESQHVDIEVSLDSMDLLVSANGNVKLAHFRWSEPPGCDNTGRVLNYSPPERIGLANSGRPHHTAMYSWSLGVLAHEMLTGGRFPFQTNSDNTTCLKIACVDYTCPETFSHLAVDFLASVLVKEPRARSNFNVIMTHAWIKSCTVVQDENNNNA